MSKAPAPIRIKSIGEFHHLRGLPAPAHPLISVVDYAQVAQNHDGRYASYVFDYYTISLKRGVNGRMRYGQQDYDFNGGVLYFMAPGQVLRIEAEPGYVAEPSGWLLLVHPDFLWNTALAKKIRQYDYFDYEVNEALFLSEREEAILNDIAANIRQEYNANIDKFSQEIIVSHIGTLLSYAERFYQRQFITRRISNHQVLDRLEQLLDAYFSNPDQTVKGLPSVKYVAGQLNVSPNYLSALLKLLTGQSTQQHIHDKLIEKAREKLSSTDLSVSEIAYALGFGHSQSFSKLFKARTNQSPLEFRASFN